jgi:hypothetical protein
MALIARAITRPRPALVFDIRGLMVEEYEEAGRWGPGGLPSRLTRAVQRSAIRRAARIVVLTNRLRLRLFASERRSTVHVIPCCANLRQIDAGRDQRDRVRRELGLLHATVMVYVGKFPSWSMPGAMADFFLSASKQIDNVHFLVLTQGGGHEIRRELEHRGASPASYTITSAPAGDVGAYLAASDFAIAFIRRAPSTIGQSPTKVGEYLGAGLPVVYSAEIGDLDELMNPEVGVRVSGHSERSHGEAAAAVLELMQDLRTPQRCRHTAERSLSLERVGIPAYCAVYEALALQLGSAATTEARAPGPSRGSDCVQYEVGQSP